MQNLKDECNDPETLKTCFRACVVEKIFAKGPEVENWFMQKELHLPIPPYTSIDLRDSGFKAVPVDSNAFPAGFNNICNEDWPVAAAEFAKALRVNGKAPKRILIIPENHTNNLFYFESLRSLQAILQLAGFEAIIGHFNPDLPDNHAPGITKVETASKQTLLLERLERKGNLLASKRQNFSEEDLILLNNDLSNGVLPELEGLSHTITPSTHMGWFQRKKGNHLIHYSALAEELAKILEIDPFRITARFSVVNDIDFDSGKNIDKLAQEVDRLLVKITEDYKTRDLGDVEPFVYVKHNSGTYGRAIMPVWHGEEVLQLNRREKNKMNISKGGVHVDSLLLMEGIATDLSHEQETAEPVIYLAGHTPIGGFLRLNPNKDNRGNLNAPGAHFKPLCYANLFRSPNPQSIVLEKFYGLLGRLSSLANAQEMLGVKNG